MSVYAGIDVGTQSVRAVVIRTGIKRTFSIDRVLEERVAIDPSGVAPREAVVAAIRSVMTRLPAVEAIYASLPGDQVSIRIVDLPPAAARRIDQVLPFELDGNIAFEISSSIVDYQPLGGAVDRQKIRLLAAAAPRARVVERLALYAEGGLDPRELACDSVCLGDLVAVTPPVPEPFATAIVDIGHERTEVAVLHGGGVEFARTLSRGGRHVTTALSRDLRIDPGAAETGKIAQGFVATASIVPETPAQARVAQVIGGALEPLIRDLRQTLGAYRAQSGVTVGQVYLVGGAARLAGLPEMIGATLGVTTSLFPFPAVQGAPADEREAGGYVKALALALRGTTRAKRVDFRKGDLAARANTREAKGVLVWTLAYLAALLLAWGFSAFARYSVLDGERESQLVELRTTTKQLLGSEIDDFARAQILAKGGRSQSDPTPRADAFVLLDEISRRIPASIVHDVEDLDIRPDRVTLRGQVSSLSDVDTLYEELMKYECFSAIERGRVTRTVDGSRQKYTFDITVRCPEEGADEAPTKVPARAAADKDTLGGQ